MKSTAIPVVERRVGLSPAKLESTAGVQFCAVFRAAVVEELYPVIAHTAEVSDEVSKGTLVPFYR